MNDAGKVAFTPKGDYSNEVAYGYLDTVVYNGNAYAALKTTTGNAPTDSDTDENWKLLARGGTSVPVATGEVAGVVKASSDIGVTNNGVMSLKTDFTAQESLAELTSGENRTTFFGKIARAVSALISHISTTATASVLGHVKLTNSVSSTSTTTAAVPANVKTAYDKAAAALPKANVSQSSAITTTGTYALDAVEKNASVNGTLANQIGKKINISDITNNLTSTATNKPLSAAQGKVLNDKFSSYPKIYNTYGWLLSHGDDSSITGLGNAIVQLYPDKIARVDFNIRIISAGSTITYDYGIIPSALTFGNNSIPNITPMAGGTLTYYGADGTISANLTEYGGTFSVANGKWTPCRYYKNDGSVGQWGSNSCATASYIVGTCYGTY